jgi:hypothetical protein
MKLFVCLIKEYNLWAVLNGASFFFNVAASTENVTWHNAHPLFSVQESLPVSVHICYPLTQLRKYFRISSSVLCLPTSKFIFPAETLINIGSLEVSCLSLGTTRIQMNLRSRGRQMLQLLYSSFNDKFISKRRLQNKSNSFF